MIFITLSQMFTVAYRIVIYLQQRATFHAMFEKCEKTQLRWFPPKNPPDWFPPKKSVFFFWRSTQGGSQPVNRIRGSNPLTFICHSRWKIFGKCIPSLVKNDVRLKDLWTSPGSCRSAEKRSPPKKSLKQFGFYGHFFSLGSF